MGDALVSFGSVGAGAAGAGVGAGGTAAAVPSLAAVAAEVAAAAAAGTRLAVRVLRSGVPTDLSLAPQPWAGQGVLGCHLVPR